MLSKFFNNLRKKPAPAKAPAEYKRFNDAILVISQDNLYSKIPIKACNDRAVRLIGYPESEINALDLRDILPPEIKEIVDDYIEFADDGKGIHEVLTKIPNFKIMASRGRPVPVKLRVIRGMSTFEHSNYQLVMSDASLIEILEQEHKNYLATHSGTEVFDLKTGLPARQCVINDMRVVIEHGKNIGYSSCFAIMTFFDDGSSIKRAGKIIAATKRDSDIMGVLSDSALIFIMPDTPVENAQIPIERFRKSLPDDVRSKLKIRCVKINENMGIEQQIKECMEGTVGMAL